METHNTPQNRPEENVGQPTAGPSVQNPFGNQQSAEKDIELSKEELENVQQAKDAQTERD